MGEIVLGRDHYLDLKNITVGAFAPLTGFMNEDDFHAVATSHRLADGTIFPIPILLDISRDQASSIKGESRVSLGYKNRKVGEIHPESFFSIDKTKWISNLYEVTDLHHPGVARFLSCNDVFVGGPVYLSDQVTLDISKYDLTPSQTRSMFGEQGWKTVGAFHTRNVPHRAHEFLQRMILDMCDGLFIQPLLGRKKFGDFTPEAIMAGYKTLVSEFYPKRKVILGSLTTAGRFAGPREAVFHAIVRRNYGCTHIVIGRDHAGVGNYYEKYASQQLCKSYEAELGIQGLTFAAPHYCTRCDGVVTEKTCPHLQTDPKAVTDISGTNIRAELMADRRPPNHIIRSEVLDSALEHKLFISEKTI